MLITVPEMTSNPQARVGEGVQRMNFAFSNTVPLSPFPWSKGITARMFQGSSAAESPAVRSMPEPVQGGELPGGLSLTLSTNRAFYKDSPLLKDIYIYTHTDIYTVYVCACFVCVFYICMCIMYIYLSVLHMHIHVCTKVTF